MKKRYKPVISYRVRDVPIDSVQVWEEAEARELDTEGIKELSESIRSEGLQNPPLVQKSGKSYKLLSGQRRLEALKRLGAKMIPVLAMQEGYELDDAKAASIIENLHRRSMSSKDMAEACNFLAEDMGSKTKAAKALGISMKTFKSYLGYRGIPDALKELVPKTISRDDATKLYRIISNVSAAVEIAHRISKYPKEAKRRYLDALEEDPTAPHGYIKRRANQLRAKQNIRLRLSKTQAKTLAKESVQQDLEPNELVRKIISDWISRRSQ